MVCGLLFALPSSAFAGTVSNFNEEGFGGPSFDGNPGETNNVTVTASPGSVTFTDAIAITADPVQAPNCAGGGTTTVTCTPPPGSATGFFSYGVFAGDLNDSITANGPLGGFLSGGEGNATVIGSNENAPSPGGFGGFGSDESLSGGEGTDVVQGGVGIDFIGVSSPDHQVRRRLRKGPDTS